MRVFRPSVDPARIAFRTFPAGILPPNSLRRRFSKRMGFRTWMQSITQRMAGFQWIASRMPRAAEGVITS